MLTTLIIGEMKEFFTRLGQVMGQKITDKQAGLNDELKNINGLTIRATIRISRDIIALNVIL